MPAHDDRMSPNVKIAPQTVKRRAEPRPIPADGMDQAVCQFDDCLSSHHPLQDMETVFEMDLSSVLLRTRRGLFCFLGTVCVAIPLAGCVNSQQTYTADGQQGHVITCTPGWTGGIIGAVASASTSWGQCYQKAGELCGAQGYDIIQQVGEGGVYGQAGQGGGFVSTTNNRMMVVKCKGGAPARS